MTLIFILIVQHKKMISFFDDRACFLNYTNNKVVYILSSAHAPCVSGITVRHIHRQQIGKTNNWSLLFVFFSVIFIYCHSVTVMNLCRCEFRPGRTWCWSLISFFYNWLHLLKADSRDRVGKINPSSLPWIQWDTLPYFRTK